MRLRSRTIRGGKGKRRNSARQQRKGRSSRRRRTNRRLRLRGGTGVTPAYYGNNVNAQINAMTYINAQQATNAFYDRFAKVI